MATALDEEYKLAQHDADWRNTFTNTPPAERIRANANLADVTDRLVARKQEQQVAAGNLNPLKAQLLQAQIEHQNASRDAAGATTAFHQQQDKEAMSHVAGFAEYMKKAPAIGTPEYSGYLLNGIVQYPRMATTAWGKDTLGKLATEHDTIESLKSQLPEGFVPKTVTVGGGHQSHITAEKPDGPVKPGEGAMRDLAKMNSALADKKSYFDKEKEAPARELLQKDMDSINAQIQAWHETYSPKKEDPKMALAQKALDDPNASEAHKAAARKLLGK